MGRDFIDRRQSNWQRLEEMLSLAVRGQLRILHREQVREFGRLYQRTAADFAIARQEIRDTRLVNYLNNLVGRSHGAIYRSKSSGFKGFWEFYRYSGPALFRETWRYTFAAFAIFMILSLFSGFWVYQDDNFVNQFAPGMLDLVKNKKNWTDRINTDNPTMSSMIVTNNARVAVYSFATGIFAGLGALFFMALNGLHIGGITALCIKYKFWPILIFMCGHGVFELTAIFIAGGAGLLMGGAMVVPGNLTRGEALIERGIKAVKLMLICLPMLLFAGIIEGFVSPAHIAPVYKYAVSTATALILIFYFSTPDRREKPTV
ncbi:MAG: stage II sporulation protein M [Blastocatellia bacterium]|nr:stage II sporulation protein M [Blastocatellia bacterium]